MPSKTDLIICCVELYSRLKPVYGEYDRTPPITKQKNYLQNYKCDNCIKKVNSEGQMCMYCNKYGAHQKEMLVCGKGQNIIVGPKCADTVLLFVPSQHPYIDPLHDACINNIIVNGTIKQEIVYIQYTTYDEHIMLNGTNPRPIIHRFKSYSNEQAKTVFGSV